MNDGWQSVIDTLQDAGYADWQIGRALAILENGGSAREADEALHDVVAYPARGIVPLQGAVRDLADDLAVHRRLTLDQAIDALVGVES